MRTKSWIALAVTILVLPVMAEAQPYGGRGGPSGGRPGRGQPAFMAELFPPELIMRNQTELGLSDAQKSAIMGAMRETRDSLDPIQWELEDKQDKLSATLAAPTVDETALLAQADEVMSLEKELKKAHLVLLVKIKNQLTPEQQETAKSLRSSSRGRFGGGPGGSPGNRPRGGGPGGGRP